MEKISKDNKSENFKLCQKYLTNFLESTIPCVVYKRMDMDSQIDLFTQLNHSKELSTFEKKIKRIPIYKSICCRNKKTFYTKLV